MNEQFVDGERVANPEILARPEWDRNSMVENPDLKADGVGTAAVMTPLAMGGMPLASVTRVDDMLEERTPVRSMDLPQTPAVAPVDTRATLLDHDISEQFRTRWSGIQGKFVDDPRSAVQEADTLVSDVVSQITEMFAREHSSLEGQWNQGNDVSTEDLRKALQHYRTFFNRLVV